MKNQQHFLFLSALLCCLYACKNGEDKNLVKGKAIDCTDVVKDLEIEVIEKTVKPDFTGEINYYYRGDSSKIDYKVKIEVGQVASYYFYDTAQHLQQENHYECGALHGVQTKYYTNGKPSETLEMDHGRRHGWHKSYYVTGGVKATENWERGKINGPITMYDSLGHKIGLSTRDAYDSLFHADQIKR